MIGVAAVFEGMDDDPLTVELRLANALRMTAAPPQAWVEVAVMLPSTLGDLDAVERLIAQPSFRSAFARDPESALRAAGLPSSKPVLAALRERLAI
jgi:hypothetical protein